MEVQDPFRDLVAQRPRLMATAAAIARVKGPVGATPAGARIRDAVIDQANGILQKEPVKPNFSRKNRMRLDHLTASREALNTLQTLGMAWFTTGDVRYVTRAKRELKSICGFDKWQDSDHFLDTAEMTHAVAIGYDWFHDQLSAAERHKIADAILKKGLQPGLAQLTGTPDPAWPTRVTNWNLVCNGGLIIGTLAVAEPGGADEIDPVLSRKLFQLCRRSVRTGLRGYAPDGAWREGPGYWTYATEYLAYMLSAMNSALGQEFGLGDAPGLAETGIFRLHVEGPPLSTSNRAGLLFNFSDSPESHSGTWCLRWLAQRYQKPVCSWVANRRKKAEAMDLLWFSPDEPPPDALGIPPNARFDGTGLVMLRGHWHANGSPWQPWTSPGTARDLDVTYVGIRAGCNTVTNHHGHLDLGGFVLDCGGARWAIDIPPFAPADANGASPGETADYNLPGYFDPRTDLRFTCYRAGTVGHNTLVVNGGNQALEVEAKIVAFAATPALAMTVLDLTAAYAGDCTTVRRGFALIDRKHVLIVDELTTRGSLPVTWQMHTRAKVTLDGPAAELTQQDDPASPARQVFLQVLPPLSAGFELQSTDVPAPQAPNTGISKLAIRIADASSPARIAVYASPNRGAPRSLPMPLAGPLSDWADWAGKLPAA